MKKLLWSCLIVVSTLACSPTNQNTEEHDHENERDYMMDDDMMEEEEAEDDSLKNRDMMSAIVIKDES